MHLYTTISLSMIFMTSPWFLTKGWFLGFFFWCVLFAPKVWSTCRLQSLQIFCKLTEVKFEWTFIAVTTLLCFKQENCLLLLRYNKHFKEYSQQLWCYNAILHLPFLILMMFFSLNLSMYTRDNSYGFYDNFNIMAKILKHFPDQDPGKTNVCIN